MNPKILVRALKDSTAQVLWAFFFARSAMYAEDIQGWTGLKRETVYKAVKGLKDIDLLSETIGRHGKKQWTLGGDVLPLIGQVLQLDDGQMSTMWTPESVVVESKSNLSSITTTITTISQESTKRTPEEEAALLSTFKKHQIIGRKRDQLHACEWVNAEYVEASVRQAKGEHWDNPVGMAISRMLEQVAAPTANASEGSKYVTGAYADYIEH